MPGRPSPAPHAPGRGGTPTGPVGLDLRAGASRPSGGARSQVVYEVKFDELSH
mgnify:CR=1 FL=1